jgi:hypothetical protein
MGTAVRADNGTGGSRRARGAVGYGSLEGGPERAECIAGLTPRNTFDFTPHHRVPPEWPEVVMATS